MISRQIHFSIITLIFLFCFPLFPVRAAEENSQCVQCHTNLKKLIRLCWEVEKTKPKAKGSAETTGEG